METITIVVDQDGGATVGVSCVKGKKCKDLTKELERALGKTTGDQLTKEYHEVDHAQARH